MEEKEVLDRLGSDAVDAVLTTVLLSKEKYYVPGYFYYSPYAMYYERYYPYPMAIYNRIYEEGYYVTDATYFQTNSTDPLIIRPLAHNYSRILVHDFVREGVLEDLGYAHR